MTPRKPNSAKRRVAKLILSNKKHIIAKLPGEGAPITKHANVLVCGHGYKDTPSANYTMIRGALECLSIFSKRRRRSIFGVKKI
jgi:small subunit ribosomal protein S12